MIKAFVVWLIIYLIALLLVFSKQSQRFIVLLCTFTATERNNITEGVKKEWELSKLEEEKLKNEKKKKRK